MINTLLEHVPIKMEVKGTDEATHNSAGDEVFTGMPKDDDKIDETDEELDDDEDDDDDDEDEEEDEESDIESDALEIEQEATMLISSDEEAELEAQRIRFPKIVVKKLPRDSDKSSRSSSRNSQTSSNDSCKQQITYEIKKTNNTTMEETAKKQRISPCLVNSENNLNKENNDNTQTLLKQKTENNKLENAKNIPDDTSNRLDNNKITADNNKSSENNRNIENLLKSDHVSGQRSRRGSSISTCSVASTLSSDNAETESCGNIYVFNLQQRLIFNCEFCDLKYGDLENFARHLHEVHKLFNFDEDPEKENAPRNLHKNNHMPKNAQKNPANVKKEKLQCLELMAEPPVALPTSVLAEPLDSCGNVFILNHRKLFLVCGYCECKYANLDLFEKHLRQQHRIFEGFCNEVNVVPKVEVKEEALVLNDVVKQPDIIAPPAMVTIPAEIPLDISITPENEAETISALEETPEMDAEINKEKPTSPPPALPPPASETKTTVETVVANEQENCSNVTVTVTATTEESEEKLPEIVNNEKSTPKKTRNKRCSSPTTPMLTPVKRSKRITRNNTKLEKESLPTNLEDKISETTPATEQILETEDINIETLPEKKIIETLPAKKIIETRQFTNSTAETRNATRSETKEEVTSKETAEIQKSNESEKKSPLKQPPIETRQTRKATKTKEAIKTKQNPPTSPKTKAIKKTKKLSKSMKQKKSPEKLATKTIKIKKSSKSFAIKKIKQECTEMEVETNGTKLKCSICQKAFANKYNLKIHERIHTGEKPYECDICHKSFGALAGLYMHKKFHMGESYKNYKCDFCEKKFFRNSDRKVHMLSHSSRKRFKCGICLRGYTTKYIVMKHIQRDHIGKKKSAAPKEELPPKTKVEEYIMPEEESAIIEPLKEPMKETPPPVEAENEIEDFSADTVAEIIEQLQNETVAKARPNEEANSVTFTINTVDTADTTSTKINSRPVVIGPQLNEVDYTDDVKPTLLKVVKRFFCDVCPRTFDKRIRLVEHKRLHTGEKPFTCDECGKQFRIRMRLNGHKLRHSKEKKFKCEICQMGFCTKQDLHLHMRHHNNDRRYQCIMCPKAFVRSSDLKIHVRVHTGEKPYMCDVCHKCFRANQNLSVHKKSHMGEASKTFQCEHCDKKFLRNIDRKVHMRSHTGEKPFKCEICQRAYSSKFNVRSHIERYHMPANGSEGPPRVRGKPGRKPKKALKEELEQQRKLIEELQNQLLQQIKTDEKVIPNEEEMLLQERSIQDSTITDTTSTSTSPLNSENKKVDPIQSAYELLSKLKSSTTTSKPLTIIPSPPPIAEPSSSSPPFITETRKDTQTNLIPLTLTQTLEQPLPAAVACSSSSSSATTSNATTCITAASPPTNTTSTKVVSQKTSLGIQQVSVTVSMQVENVAPNPIAIPEKENDNILTSSSSGSSIKKERKITSYFTVLSQKTDA